jgi:multidrug resistance efflux pump
MSQTTINPAPISIPPRVKTSRRSWAFLWIAVIAALCSGGVLLASGVNPISFWKDDPSTKLPTVEVDRGDIPVYAVESGSLESADNATIKCEVEALLGLVTSNIATGANSMNVNNRVAATNATATAGTTTTAAATKAAAGTAASATKVGASGAGAATKGAAGGTSATAAIAAAASSTGGVARPTIQSFTMVVQPHVPLRGALTSALKKTGASIANAANAANRARGGGNRNNNGPATGSTRILWIEQEGKHVKPGDIVAKLDSAAFIDERRAELIRVAQARSWVEQAERVLEVTKIALDEYENGIYPQDKMLIDQYIESCQTQVKKARLDLAWARGIMNKGLRSEVQFKADQLTAVKSDIVLIEAFGMRNRLEKYTAPRLITNIKAKIDSVTSDLYAQQEAFKLEEDRLKRLEKMIEKCTLRAPREGIVVYANESNGWGRVEAQIMEGATVHEGQPIINLPNPKFMRVRAKVNESKIARIKEGIKARVIADAFPETPLPGLVTEVTAIPGPANGPISDVKVYFATVRLQDGKVDGLRPGMTAEIAFEVDRKNDVTRVPLQAIRWLDGEAYAAIPGKRGPRWKKLELGLLNPTYAEVITGLEPGDRVVQNPEALPDPEVGRLDSAARSTHDNRG